MLESLFGPADSWPGQDLIAFSADFDPGIALLGYRCGVFPMPLTDGEFCGEMGWWSPMQRAQLLPESLRLTRSLRKSARRYSTTVDQAFDQVIAGCADPSRQGGWIDRRIVEAFTVLQQAGYVHSVETWDAQGRLVGGLYGVHQNGMFAGESMFHHPQLGTDASKVALLRLTLELRNCGVELLDVQWLTDHLASLGAVATDRADYLQQLAEALEVPHHDGWARRRLTGAELLERLGQEWDAGIA